MLCYWLIPVVLLSFFSASAQSNIAYLSIPGDTVLTTKELLRKQIDALDSSQIEHLHITAYEKKYAFQDGKNVFPEFFCLYDVYLQNLNELYQLIPWEKWSHLKEVTLPFADSISPNYLKNIRRYFTLNWTYGLIYPYTSNYETLPIKELHIGKPSYAQLNTESFNKLPSRLQRFSIPTVNGITEISDLNYIGIDMQNWNRQVQVDNSLTPIKLSNFENVNFTLYERTLAESGLNINEFSSVKNLSINSGNYPRTSKPISFQLSALKQLKRLTVNGDFWTTNSTGKTDGNTVESTSLEALILSNYRRDEVKFEGSLNNTIFTSPSAPVKFWDPLFITSVTTINCPELNYLNVKSNYNFPNVDECVNLETLVLSTSSMRLLYKFRTLKKLTEFHLVAVDSNAYIHVPDTFAFPVLQHFIFEKWFPLNKMTATNDTTQHPAFASIELPFLLNPTLKKVTLESYDQQVWETLIKRPQLDILELSEVCILEMEQNNRWESLTKIQTIGTLVLHQSKNEIQLLDRLRTILSESTIIEFQK